MWLDWRRVALRKCGREHSLVEIVGTELDGCCHITGIAYFQLVEYQAADCHKIL